MENTHAFVISFVSIFAFLAIIPEGTLTINAQGDSARNNSTSGTKTTYLGNSSSIITPWNTGNDRNNISASSNS